MPLYVALVASFLATGLLWLVAPAVLGRDLLPWELGLAFALACLLLVAWGRHNARRRRERREGLRDSALW